MYKILYLPTGNFVQCSVRNADVYTLQYDFIDWKCSDLMSAEAYLDNNLEVWGDLVCTTQSRRKIGIHWITKHYGKRAKPPFIEHFEIMEYPDV
jgi:hypothetical protein